MSYIKLQVHGCITYEIEVDLEDDENFDDLARRIKSAPYDYLSIHDQVDAYIEDVYQMMEDNIVSY